MEQKGGNIMKINGGLSNWLFSDVIGQQRAKSVIKRCRINFDSGQQQQQQKTRGEVIQISNGQRDRALSINSGHHELQEASSQLDSNQFSQDQMLSSFSKNDSPQTMSPSISMLSIRKVRSDGINRLVLLPPMESKLAVPYGSDYCERATKESSQNAKLLRPAILPPIISQQCSNSAKSDYCFSSSLNQSSKKKGFALSGCNYGSGDEIGISMALTKDLASPSQRSICDESSLQSPLSSKRKVVRRRTLSLGKRESLLGSSEHSYGVGDMLNININELFMFLFFLSLKKEATRDILINSVMKDRQKLPLKKQREPRQTEQAMAENNN